jgi:hypothetical protein
MTELSDKERAHASLEILAGPVQLTEGQRNKLHDTVQGYIFGLELQLRILG